MDVIRDLKKNFIFRKRTRETRRTPQCKKQGSLKDCARLSKRFSTRVWRVLYANSFTDNKVITPLKSNICQALDTKTYKLSLCVISERSALNDQSRVTERDCAKFLNSWHVNSHMSVWTSGPERRWFNVQTGGWSTRCLTLVRLLLHNPCYEWDKPTTTKCNKDLAAKHVDLSSVCHRRNKRYGVSIDHRLVYPNIDRSGVGAHRWKALGKAKTGRSVSSTFVLYLYRKSSNNLSNARTVYSQNI